MANPAVALIYRTAREMSADDATHMAAGLAYYAVLSLFPLAIGLISLLGLLLESGEVRTTYSVSWRLSCPLRKDCFPPTLRRPAGFEAFSE